MNRLLAGLMMLTVAIVMPRQALAVVPPTTVATGYYHSCGMIAGVPKCWGYNYYGQVGDGTTTDRANMVNIDTSGALSGQTVTGLYAGGFTTCGVTSAGKAYCWGQNNYGQLGDGTTTNRSSPVAVDTSGVLAGRNIAAMAVGLSVTCALDSAGQVYCWGRGDLGALGNGASVTSGLPVAVTMSGALNGLTVTQISSMDSGMCVLASNSKEYCWGQNNFGSVGNGSTSNRNIPTAVSTALTMTKIGSNISTSCAVASTQRAYCWGYNGYGQIGNNTSGNWFTAPVAVSTSGVLSGVNIAAVTSGLQSCALSTAGRVYCWGGGGNGSLGNGTNTSYQQTPVAVSTSGVLNGATVTSMSTGQGHTCAVTATNAVVCWGMNDFGELGNGTKTSQNVPVAAVAAVTPPGTPTSPQATAGDHTVSVTWTAPSSAGTSPITGYRATLSDGSYCDSVGVALTCTVNSVANGVSYTATVTATSADGTSVPSAASNSVLTGAAPSPPLNVRLTPGDHQLVVGWDAPASAGSSAITGYAATLSDGSPCNSVGAASTCTVTGLTNGTGYTATVTATNGYGNSAPSAASSSAVPSAPSVPSVPPNVTVTLGYYHSCALMSGVPKCWGNNGAGQLGDGTNNNRNTIGDVDTSGVLSGQTITGLYAGGYSTCAVTSAGKAYCWGYNGYGQLGDGTTTDRNSPVAVDTGGVLAGKNIVQMAVGLNTICALDSAGKVYCSGRGDLGALGNSSLSDSSTPVAVTTSNVLSGLTVTQISPLENGMCALASDGKVYCWGHGSLGSNGNGSYADKNEPVAVNTGGVLSGLTIAKLGSGFYTMCAISSTQRLFCWGYNGYGQVGDGTGASPVYTSPIAVDAGGVLSGVDITDVSSGVQTCARSTAGAVYCWGYGGNGSLGDGTNTTYAYAPVAVSISGVLNGTTVSGISSGNYHSCGATASNTVVCWGQNDFGQLGNRSNINSNVPVTAVVATTPPGAPTSPQATAGDQTVTVTWTAPSSPGTSPITGYTVTLSDGTPCPTSGALTCTVSHLPNNTTYTATVTATSNDGTSSPSTTSNSVLTGVAPSPPLNVQLTPGDQQVVASWTTPASAGSSAITGYALTLNDGSSCSPVGTALTCTVTSLTNGNSYTATATATNAYGTSSPSATSAAATPAAAPSPPQNVRLTAGDQQVVVNWDLPTSAGSSAITGYTVTLSDGSQCSPVGTALTCTVSGLTNGTSYTATVTATSAVGTSTASSTSPAAKPGRAPSAPRNVRLTPSDKSLVVVWDAPASTGSSAVTGYTVTLNDGSTCTSAWMLVCSVTGLTNGVPYTATVTATSGAGTSAASTPSTPVRPAAPSQPPTSPSDVSAVPDDASAIVSWAAAGSMGSGTFTRYTATASPGGASCTTAFGTGCTITGLTNHTQYTISVVTETTDGVSAPSGASPVVTPGKPVLEPEPPATPDGKLDSSVGTVFDPATRTTVLTGTGYAPNTPVQIAYYSTPTVLMTVVTDASGNFSQSVSVPAELTGTHTFVATGSAPDGSTHVLSLAVKLVATSPAPVKKPTGKPTKGAPSGTPDGPDDLPITGPWGAGLVGLGLLSILLGLVAVAALRRRRVSP